MDKPTHHSSDVEGWRMPGKRERLDEWNLRHNRQNWKVQMNNRLGADKARVTLQLHITIVQGSPSHARCDLTTWPRTPKGWAKLLQQNK